ncbi:Beta-TrCP [Dactylella cylindrospora]|nr:Beta-TrCP [Dactylella cylindrospora]
MVKSYARFGQSRSFGVIASATSNIIWTPDTSSSTSSRNTSAGLAIVPANEEVLTWDVKKGELVARWRDSNCKSEVTCIKQSKTDEDIFAVGHADGTIRLWDSKTGTIIVTFNGHKSGITALCYDSSGTRLASGSRDTDIIVWDLVAEVGLYKLRGHKDQITGLEFLHFKAEDFPEDVVPQTTVENGYLLTISKDTLIKLWDLSSQHCVETHVAHSGECWAIGVTPDEEGAITAGNDGELKIWTIERRTIATASAADDVTRVAEKGTIHRASRERPYSVCWHANGRFIAVNGSDKSVEIFKVRNEKEIQKVLTRKRKRKRGKGKEDTGEDVDMEDQSITLDVADVFVQHTLVRTPGKARSVHWAHTGKSSRSMQLMVSCTNNLLELYDIPTSKEKSKDAASKEAAISEYNRLYSVELPGHRTDVRALALSSDDSLLASASSGSLKIWNVRTGTCVRTFECGYALCCAFLPGDKIVVVGTKSGDLELFDVASAVMIESVQAHEKEIWSLHVHPDGRGMVTGSADKSAKFWNFEIVQEEVLGTSRTTPKLRLVNNRVLKLNDDILSLKFTPNGQLLAVALLDNTVKVFFTDSLKLLHNLYGHKLPVLAMDISSDSKLVVTSSADKNVRLWGLDFGDCHKSFFAHTDSVMSVGFEKTGHNFFSASKDRMLKYWDGDKFENIMKMEGHFGEVWAMAVSKGRGEQLVVSAGHDRSIRIWEETDDQIFLEEEREKELEELYESNLTQSLEQTDLNDDDENAESARAGKQTMETLMAGERIIEALDYAIADLNAIDEYKAKRAANPSAAIALPQRNMIFLALGDISAEQHVFNVVSKIQPSHLQDALLILPFDKVTDLFRILEVWAKREWNMPLTCRIIFFLLKTHHESIVASKGMRVLLEGIRGALKDGLRRQKDEMGFNLAGVRYVKERAGEKGKGGFLDVEEFEKEEEEERKGRKKRAFMTIA